MEKRVLSFLLVLGLVFSMLPGTALAAGTSGNTATNGNPLNATWYLDESGKVLTLRGTREMGNGHLTGSSTVETVIIEEGITSIGNDAFDGFKLLSHVTLPQSITAIGQSAFASCESLTELILPDAVSSIGPRAFDRCEKLTGITIPANVKEISENTFRECYELERVTIPNGVLSIRNSAFYNCSKLTDITIPDSVTSIGESAFYDCDLLDIEIPSKVNQIGKNAFGFTALQTATIPSGVTLIDEITFQYCRKLSSITIPSSVGRIADFAFSGCDGLKDVYFKGSQTQWEQVEIGRSNDYLTSATIHFLGEEAKTYSLRFYPNGGTGKLPEPAFYKAGEVITLSVAPSREGYIFAGWSDGQKTYQPGERFTMPEKNVTLTAQWTQQIATNPMFSYDINGGTAVGIPQSERKVPNEMIIVTTVVPERAGYRFMGWSDGQKAYKAGDFFSMPDTDLVLSAQWKKLYSLGFNPDGGTGNLPEPAFYVEGEIVMLPAAPSKDGLVFAGWSDGLHTYPAGSQFTMPRNDLVLKALWDIELLYVQQLTQYSLANADAATRETIQNAIYNLLFKAQFRPSANEVNDISFGSYSQTLTQKQVIINYWPAKNWSGASQSSIADAVLGSINLNVNSRGCYAYGKFVSKYVWGTTGSSTSRVTTAAGLKALIEAYADPGEHIRINNTHSVVFLGESSDRNGFYCSEYIDDPYGIRVTYYTYQKFAKMYSGISMFLYDTNGGSYYSETAKSIATIRAENNATTREILRFACPVEVVVKLENEILDSRSVANDGEIAFASFGSVERDDKTLVFELQHNENYKIEIVGIGEGGMTLTVEHYWNEDMIDRRIFVSVPITSKTDIEAHGFDVLGSFVLFVYPDGTEESESTWGAGAGETVYAADMSYSSRHHKYPGNDIDNNAPSVPGHSDSPISPNNLSNANYPIALSGVSNGTVSINPSKASKGTTITLTAIPNIGYKLATLTATDSKGNGLKLTDKGEGKSSFIMPASAVKVEAVFVLAEIPWTNPFSDVSNDDWHYEAVRFVQERGLMNGYSDSRFGPNEPLSRAQLAQILFNKVGRPMVNYLLDFSDVAGEAWYTEAIRWATSQGIVGGYGNGKFGPNDPITREQLAVMLWRYSGSPAATNKELNFTDADEISGFALEAMRWAVENGILNGYGDGRLGPQGQATRAQVAQMLKNYLESYQ